MEVGHTRWTLRLAVHDTVLAVCHLLQSTGSVVSLMWWPEEGCLRWCLWVGLVPVGGAALGNVCLAWADKGVQSAFAHGLILIDRIVGLIEVVHEATACWDQVACTRLGLQPLAVLCERDLAARVPALHGELLLLLLAQQTSLDLAYALLEVGVWSRGKDGRLLCCWLGVGCGWRSSLGRKLGGRAWGIATVRLLLDSLVAPLAVLSVSLSALLLCAGHAQRIDSCIQVSGRLGSWRSSEQVWIWRSMASWLLEALRGRYRLVRRLLHQVLLLSRRFGHLAICRRCHICATLRLHHELWLPVRDCLLLVFLLLISLGCHLWVRHIHGRSELVCFLMLQQLCTWHVLLKAVLAVG